MTIKNTIAVGTFNVHQLNAQDFAVLCDAENLVMQVANAYPEDTQLMNPNTGEVVVVDELRRVAGILDFLSTTRVVEVDTPNRK